MLTSKRASVVDKKIITTIFAHRDHKTAIKSRLSQARFGRICINLKVKAISDAERHISQQVCNG